MVVDTRSSYKTLDILLEQTRHRLTGWANRIEIQNVTAIESRTRKFTHEVGEGRWRYEGKRFAIGATRVTARYLHIPRNNKYNAEYTTTQMSPMFLAMESN